MAKDDKAKGKPAGEDPGDRVRRYLTEILALTLFLVLISRLFYIYSYDSNIRGYFLNIIQSYGLAELFLKVVFYVIVIGILLTILFIAGIIYLAIKLHAIQKIWNSMLAPVSVEVSKKEIKNEKWQKILTHIDSNNSSDWRLAILECDIVLDELFDKLGYVGGTIGDKLKAVDPAKFKTLNNAWEAHKIRNAIAHEGQDFNMTDREARRVIGLYETVFKEFDFI